MSRVYLGFKESEEDFLRDFVTEKVFGEHPIMITHVSMNRIDITSRYMDLSNFFLLDKSVMPSWLKNKNTITDKNTKHKKRKRV